MVGATGTGKTRTLQAMTEGLSDAGVPVFVADIKGDLSGLLSPGTSSDKLLARTASIGQEWSPASYPVELYTLGGLGTGVPIRTTVTDFGPLLLAKVLGLNDTQESSLGLIFHWADTQGLDLSSVGALEPRVRTWYNPERRSSDFLIPGLMVVIIAIVTVQQTAVTLVRERDLGTEEQLEVSPLHKVELMVAKLLPWTVIAFIDVAAIIWLGRWLFGVPVRGDLGALAVGSALFVLAALGLGLLVSAIAPTTDTANILALMIAFLPSFLLSGLAFALDQIPAVLQWISYAFPARYMVTISRVVFLKGGGFAEVWPELLALGGYAVAMIAISTVLHGRRAAR